MFKRGLNQIVTTVLIILIVLVAIGIIWFFLRPLVTDSSQSITSEQYVANFAIVTTSVLLNETNQTIDLKVQRKTGGPTPIKMAFVLEDAQRQTRKITADLPDGFNELETKSFHLEYSELGMDTPTKVSIAGVFLINTQETTGVFTDTYQFGSYQPIQGPNYVCGNGFREPGEGCDDGNLLNNDGCSASCGVERFAVQITSPTQATYGSTNIFLNYSIIDDAQALRNCWYNINSGQNTSLTGCANTTLVVPSGSVALKVYANTSYGLVASDSVNFTVTVGAPQIVLNAPPQGAIINLQQVTFSYTPTGTGIANCSLLGNFAGPYGTNQTISSISNGSINSFNASLSEGTFLWAVSCVNNQNIRATTTNRTLVVDRTSPFLVIRSPQATTYSTSEVFVDTTITEPGSVSFSLNGGVTNISLVNSSGLDFTYSLMNLVDGATYTMDLYAKDLAGNQRAYSVQFSIEIPTAPACELVGAEWTPLVVTEGGIATMIVDSENCNGQQFDLWIWEHDTITGDDLVNPQAFSAVAQSDQVRYTWASEWQEDEFISDPEYYFVARAVANQSITISSPNLPGQRLIVRQASPQCGNNITQAGEQCDDGNSNNNDACTNTCHLAVCGDGFTRTGVEGCDDGNTVTEQCAYGNTSCSVCNGVCQLVPGATQFCGDGTRNGGEICDGSQLGGQTCGGLGFTGGTLTCSSMCTYDTSGCSSSAVCGDGTVTPPEICELGQRRFDCASGCRTCVSCSSWSACGTCGTGGPGPGGCDHDGICDAGETSGACAGDCGPLGTDGDIIFVPG